MFSTLSRAGITFCLALAVTSPALAGADTQDDQYLAALSAMGITASPPDPLIQYAHGICDNPQAELPLKLGLMGQTGVTMTQTMSVTTAAFRTYCPDKLNMLPPFLR